MVDINNFFYSKIYMYIVNICNNNSKTFQKYIYIHTYTII